MPNKKYDWESIIQEQATSGLTIKAYCDRHNINTCSFYNFKKKIKGQSSISTFLPLVVTQPLEEERISLRMNQTLVEIPASLLSTIIQQLT